MQAGFNTSGSGSGGSGNNNNNNSNNNGEAAAAAAATAAAGYMVDQAGCSHYVNMVGGQYGFMPGGHHHQHHHMISGAAGNLHHLPPPSLSGGAASASDQPYLDSIKASILSHPLFMQLLAAHVACLQVAAPFAAGRGAQLAASSPQDFVASYLAALPPSSAHHLATSSPYDRDELNHFMVSYILLLQSFKEELQEHLTTQATEAMAACWEIEQSLYDLTGVSVGPGDGSLMPQDEKRNEEINYNYSYSNYNYNDYIARSNAGLVDAYFCQDFDKSLIDHVRRELKKELKEDYRSKLRDVREEILRKRRAGKLPGETTHVLKDWWTSHAKWPYPTEEEKARLAEESGLELKQINNWFINQRKRNWQSEINQDGSTSNDEKMIMQIP